MASTQRSELCVVGRDGCPQCEVMKVVLDDYGIPYRYENVAGGTEQRKKMLDTYGSDTFPLVFFNNEYLGNTKFAVWVNRAFDKDGDSPALEGVVEAWRMRQNMK